MAKQNLSPAQYHICFLKGTESPGSGKYNQHYEPGMYKCAVCWQELFASDTKYDSGTGLPGGQGWPSFFDILKTDRVNLDEDRSLGMVRTEVTCSRCGSHLGHVFNDGPRLASGKASGPPLTRARYCINSLALEFSPKKK